MFLPFLLTGFNAETRHHITIHSITSTFINTCGGIPSLFYLHPPPTQFISTSTKIFIKYRIGVGDRSLFYKIQLKNKVKPSQLDHRSLPLGSAQGIPFYLVF